MTASIRTLIYAGVAACFAVGAYATHQAMQPSDLSGFDLVGQEFYPKFTEPDKAARLRVAAYDDLNEKPLVFTVEKDGDSWRIPSHHDYPAEAKKRLAETAASVMGVERLAVAGRGQAEYERYGVIDPLDEESTAIRGRGQRITLFDDKGKELVDLIVGNQVEGQSDQYYVRLPKEKETYRTKLNVQLSTKFADWIEPDLLKLTGSDLVSLVAIRPIIEEKVFSTPFGPRVRNVRVGDEEVQLTREESGSDWQLTDLNDAVEEFDDSSISGAVTALDDLKIVGVRPKPRGINSDFSLDFPKEVMQDERLFQQLLEERSNELQSKGFSILVDENRRPSLFTKEGNLSTATKQGVVYRLHFGNEFEGSLDDIEFGSTSKESEETKKEKPAAESDPPDDESKKSSDKSGDSDSEDVQRGRYVLVRAEFDAKYLGDEPVAPIEPKKPAADDTPKKPATDAPDTGNKDKKTDKQPASEDQAGDKNNADKNDGEEKSAAADKASDREIGAPEVGDSDAEKAADDKPADTSEKKTPSEQEVYEEAMKDYISLKIKYESDKEDYDKNVKEGEKTVKQLNDRFKNWYYVISSKSFETLRISRDKLVKQKDVIEQPPVEAPNPPSAAAVDPPESN